MGALALACTGALALTACGSDDDSSTDAATSTGAATAATEAGSKATGAPIKVGMLSPSLGVGAIPEPGIAAKAAVKRINEQLGGVNDRPIDLVVCETDASPEKNIGCANQLVSEKVAVVIDGFDFTAAAATPVLSEAKIPVVGPIAFSPQSEAQKGSFYLGASQGTLAIGPLLSFKDQGLKDITFSAADLPATRGYFDGFIGSAAKSMGLNFNMVYYPLGNPNFQSIASTIAAEDPQVAGVPGDEGQCLQLVRALRGTGFEDTAFTGFCTAYIKELGAEQAGKAQMYSSVWLPQMKPHAPAEVQEQLEMAESDLQAAGDPAKQGYFSYATYGTVMTLADVLRSVDGTINGASVEKALGAAKDMPSFLGPNLTCDGTKWPKSTACSNELIVASLQPDGSLKPNEEAGFLAVSPSLLPKSG